VPDSDVVDHVSASTGLSRGDAARVVEDVLAYYAEPTEDFVRRRHAYYRSRGVKNPAAFALIAAELQRRVVAAPTLTERQLRRIIYG
jgi:hypothetical protein